MDSPAAKMQRRLEQHFDDLRVTRDTSSYPIFALEHGLEQNDVKEIQSMLRLLPSGKSLLSSRYWLLWVVYATELGYDYAGDEYWSSFEEKTPKWHYHDRAKVKAWFRKFQNIYGGVIPSGAWADHFSIIAWPITHAILPLDLQRQFAKHLYDLRFRLASSSTLGTNSVGRLLFVHAGHASTRFRAFLEQEELTGQIVAALLGGNSTAGELIHQPTLQRIIADLEQVRKAREWLNETRRAVSDRFKGIGQGAGDTRVSGSSTDRFHLDTSHLSIRPSLLLRHVGSNTWSAFLELKSFRPVAALDAEVHAFLDGTRCRLNGADDFKPTGWLLSGNRKGALRSWPDSSASLIHFERPAPPAMDHLLKSEVRLHPGPIWLFRVGTDGIARHVLGRVVRPGLHYIVVTTASTPEVLEEPTPCDLHCAGAKAYRLAVPSLVSAEMAARFQELDLHVARTIRVWPAGLPGRGWDGEGSSEYLTTESPCFGIAHDHPMESLSFHLNDEPAVLIHTDGGGEYPLFVRLPPMPAGTHKLIVRANRSADLERVVHAPSAEGFVQLTVRDPEPWTPGVTSYAGLIVRTDPDHADLDALWRNEIDLSVNGPEGFTATFFLTLRSADGTEILSERLGPLDLPIAPNAWRERFGRFLDDKTHAWRYLEATTCTLEIRADTLGTWTRLFEHRALPLRWVMRCQRQTIMVRLIDDNGQDETNPNVMLYSMAYPFESATPPNISAARLGYVVEPPGFLFVAEHGQYFDAAFVSNVPAQGLIGLGVEPIFPELERSARKLAFYFRLLKIWCNARLFGFLADLRHRKVTSGAVDALRAVLCGDNWARAERYLGEHPESRAALESLAALVDKRTGFGNVLCRRLEKGVATRQASALFVDEAARNNVCRDRDLSRFALCLASDQPLVVARVADHPGLESFLAKLISNPAILRAARLQRLMLKADPEGASDGTLLGGYSP